MPAMEPLCYLLGVNPHDLSKDEYVILEVELFARIYEALKEIFTTENKDYFRLIKLDPEVENITMEAKFVRCIINDILSTEEYSIEGIAYYTHLPEDVIYDVITEKSVNPSFSLLRKIIELHRTVRPALYKEIIKKIISQYARLQ